MGLDMYLSKKTYVKNWDHNSPAMKTKVTVLKGGKKHPAIKPERVVYIVEEVAYWRKANMIHGWFVEQVQDGVDNCQESYVEKAKLVELVGICERLLTTDKAKLKEVADELLPPTPGFFFGAYEVDEYYLEDLRDTVRQLKPLLEETDEDSDGFYYRASW